MSLKIPTPSPLEERVEQPSPSEKPSPVERMEERVVDQKSLHKFCPTCEQNIPLVLFYKKTGSKTGTMFECKVCANKRRRIWAKKNPEKDRARYSYEKYRARMQQIMSDPVRRKNMYDKHKVTRSSKDPSVRRARWLVFKAVKEGILVRPVNCPICERSDRKIQGHHADYSKPLEVEWMCPTCHARTHHNCL